MFKLVVVCAFLAAAAAKPDVLLTSLTPYTTTGLSSGWTTISNQASSLIHPSQLTYSAPWGYSHLIKKRSPQLPLNYYTPTTYYATSPVAGTGFTTLHNSPYFTSTLPLTHLIKKRSAQLTYAYGSPVSYTTPLYASTYTTNPLYSSPLISQPYSYSTHFIKKRSAPAWSSYIAPSSYSLQSKFGLTSSPLVTSYSTPYAYSGSLATHFY